MVPQFFWEEMCYDSVDFAGETYAKFYKDQNNIEI